jgi:plasmid stabilization system protein ParE
VLGKIFTFKLGLLAESDLEEIRLYTFQKWLLERRKTYHRSLKRAIEGLASRENVWQKSNIQEGYGKYSVGKQVIFFAEKKIYLMRFVFYTKNWI